MFLEGLIVGVVACVGALSLFPDQTGVVSIFLCAIGSIPSVERHLALNRTAILAEGRRPVVMNVYFTGQILALFAGQFTAYWAVASVLDPMELARAFAQQLGPYTSMSFAHLRFPAFSDVAAHNLGVLGLFFGLGLFFKHGGALLAVAWNASVWGTVFGWLARRWTESGGPQPVEAYGRVLMGVLPHMALEAGGYVVAGFAGVFLRQAIASYGVRSPHWASLLRTLSLMLPSAAALVVLGAIWESTLSPTLVRWLSAGH
jgi:Stage II sporulation protein M